MAAGDDVDSITDAIVTASRVLVSLSARSIASVDPQLTIPQFRVLVILETLGVATLTELAGRLDVQKSTAGRMVDRLVQSGTFTRTENPESRRERNVELTPAGRRIVERVTRRRRAEIGEIVAGMPDRQRTGLVRALEAFAAAADEPAVDAAYWM
ncbi:MarR family transcriptional regulator [Tsukamurella soli]|uniref:MarR family transcriptional regulator n=1 Tax=Tsukamurella soli TaxID=644556 RepID=A0ABP8JB21_9ACTN